MFVYAVKNADENVSYFLSHIHRGVNMDIYASAALTGMGYTLQQQRDNLKRQEFRNTMPHPKEVPSMKNIYSSDNWNNVRADEQRRGNNMWNKAQNPWDTGVVAKPAYASMFSAPTQNNQNNSSINNIRTLAGNNITREEFTHNNMQPYFRGSVKQNIDPFANKSVLENYTGRSDFIPRKQEVEAFFEPTSGYGNVCGMNDNSDFYLSHINAPIARNNDFPIEQIRVGPGLNAGFTATPDGGFQQSKSMDFARPKTVDELRVATKPKLSYEIPVQGPAKGTTQRGEIGQFDKNRVDTYYEQTPDMWLKTTGANQKERQRPFVEVKPTARVDTHVEYQGVSQTSSSKPGKGTDDDYGKSSVMIYDNERQVTESRTVVSNLTSTVKAIIAPLLDVMKPSKQEYTIDAPRVFGNMQPQIPTKATTYDPVNHMMRTTIKETTIHDTNVANLKGADRVTAAIMDEAKTTVRQTLPVEDQVRNVASHSYRVTVYNPEEVAKTTVKETLGKSGSMYGFISGDVTERVGAYSHIDVQVPNTQKQFVSDYEYEGAAKSQTSFEQRSREAENNAEIDGTREALNIAAGHTPNGSGLYESLPPEAVDITTKKPAIDSMASRSVGNVTRIAQPTSVPDIRGCEVTKPAGPLLNGEENRLDPNILSSLTSNPYHVSVSGI